MGLNAAYNTFHFILNHPLAGKQKIRAIGRFISWQFISRFYKYPIVYPFVLDSKLIVAKGMTGATGNVYTGLHEYEEMAFLLHVLRPGDLFGDIGANIGAYTVLASGVIKSNSISIEPVAKTFLHLKHNVAINDMEHLVTLFHCGIGSEKGRLNFTCDEDTINHVVTENEHSRSSIESVDIISLDEAFSDRLPVLLKIDVEGFEMAALQGAKRILGEPALKGIIIEINGLCRRYGVSEDEIHQLLLTSGFNPIAYNPVNRNIRNLMRFNQNGNTIYIRDLPWIRNRVSQAPKIEVLDQLI
jgi:FkbM family methyltransferase